MRILFALTYYRPHISGLTIHVQRLAEGLAGRGHDVTVLTSRYRRHLPLEEHRAGVRVRRVPVWWRLGKGVVSPGVGKALAQELSRHDVLALSVPANPDAVWLARVLAARRAVPTVVVFGCDVRVPDGWAHAWLERWCRYVYRQSLVGAVRVLVLSQDYADHTRPLDAARDAVTSIAPPIAMPAPSAGEVAAFRHRFGLREGDRHVLLAARVAREKGVDQLISAMQHLARASRPYRLLITGDQPEVIGEQRYQRSLREALARLGDRVVLTGELSDRDMAACFAACDVTTLPSVNATESFGMVQVESMLCGTPVVASDLPGVREAISRTGMGRLVPAGDGVALAEALEDVAEHRDRYTRPRAAITAVYSQTAALDAHERLFTEVIALAKDRQRIEEARRAEFGRQTRQLPVFRALVRSVEVQLVRDLGPLQTPSLDLGTGDGHFGAALGHHFTFGLDADGAALRIAASRGAHRCLIHGDATKLPFASGTLATIIANSTLEHVRGLDAALAELGRVLRPGGRLIVTAPSQHFASLLGVPGFARRFGLARAAARYERWFNQHSQHHTTAGPDRWREHLDAHAMQVVQARYYLSPAAHRVFDGLHYLGLPNLVAHRVAGDWVPRWLRPWNAALRYGAQSCLKEAPAQRPGPYVLIVAERRT